MGSKIDPQKEQELLDTSLRNVRSLVDAAQAEEAEKRTQAKRTFIALGIAVLLLVVLVGFFAGRKPPGQTVTIKPAPSTPK